MKNRAAVYFEGNSEWKVIETDLEPPRAGEVLVRMGAAGLCHSDDHIVQGDMVQHDPEHGIVQFPQVGGHEGAGVVEAVGEGVTSVEPGDHVVVSWIPSCGRCRMCVTGFQMLCDSGRDIQNPGRQRDKARHHYDGDVLYSFGVGTFSERAVCAEQSLIKIDDDIPLEVAALVGCCVLTGWGSAVNRAPVVPGDVVVVVGLGGLGSAALQGAKLAGARHIIGIDPVPFKRDMATQFGATHVSETMETAFGIVQQLTGGLMADKVIITVSLLFGNLIEPAISLTRKGGTCVATAVAPKNQTEISLNLLPFIMSNKELKGCLYGMCNPRSDIPRVLDLYRSGLIKIDEMITTRYPLSDINQGYQDLRDGVNIRGVIAF